MGSFFSRLFGGSSGDSGPKRSKPTQYKDYLICAAPQRSGDSWNLAGVIIKPGEDGENAEEGEDTNMEREFIRADIFTSQDEAISFSLRKGEQIIDEQGARLFANGEKTGRA